MGNYSVYKHTSPSGKVYIGITGRDVKDRWDSGHGYKGQVFGYAILKYGWENITHEVLYTGISEQEAKQKEKELIALYNSTDSKFGYNVTPGGDAQEYHAITNDFRNKRREYMTKLWKSPEYRKSHCIAIVKVSSDGKIIEEYDSLSEAASKNKCDLRSIKSCCDGNISRTRKGDIFRYKNKATGNKVLFGKRYNSPSLYKKVTMYSDDGQKIKTFDSIEHASAETKINASSITACCKNKLYFCGGYIWKYASEELGKEELCERVKHKKTAQTPVSQYTMDGKYIATYKSMRDASKSSGADVMNIKRVCDGTYKQSKGYIWRYADVT